MANLIITIDGPAASGKSTAARLLAEKLQAVFLDTGAMYRAVTLAAMEAGADMEDERQLLGVLEKNRFRFAYEDGKMKVFIDGLDVTERLREPEVTANARYVASATTARRKLVEMQRDYAANCEKVVTEGRDQGTVAFSDADIKFYLVAEVGERTRRRQAELAARNKKENFEQIKKSIEDRDNSDRSREVGPLKPADDAIVVDTTDLSIEKVVEKLLNCIEEKCPEEN